MSTSAGDVYVGFTLLPKHGTKIGSPSFELIPGMGFHLSYKPPEKTGNIRLMTGVKKGKHPP